MACYQVIPRTLGWYLVIGVFITFVIAMLTIGKFVSEKNRDRVIRCIGFYLLLDLLFLQGFLAYRGSYLLSNSMPLAYCSIMQLVAAFAAITRKPILFEIGILFGITGPLQAFVSPAVVCEGQEYVLIDYFISHGLTITVPLYLCICCKQRIRRWAFIKACLFVQVVVFCVYFIDVSLGANYMYLVQRPPVSHPLNYGKWPYYLFAWHGVFYAIGACISSIFWLERYINEKTKIQ